MEVIVGRKTFLNSTHDTLDYKNIFSIYLEKSFSLLYFPHVKENNNIACGLKVVPILAIHKNL